MKKFDEWRAESEYNQMFVENNPHPWVDAMTMGGEGEGDEAPDDGGFSMQDWSRIRALAGNRLQAAPTEVTKAKRFLEPLREAHPDDKDFIMTTLAAAFAVLSDKNIMNRTVGAVQRDISQ